MKLKVYYSHTPFWRAEVLRVCLFIGNIPFEDIRISREEFKEVILTGKLYGTIKIPFNQLPVLEIDGKIIGQTGAIARYCGKLSNLYPKDDFLCAKVDQIIDTATDITNLVSPTVREKNESTKKEMRERLTKKLLPRWFNYLENILQIENDGKWFVDNKLSIADIAIWRLLGWLKSGMLDGIPTNICDNYPKLNNINIQVHKHPKVQEWMLKTYGKEI
jgi:prostaglandin-H2 D-isomerase / glutathione transferase